MKLIIGGAYQGKSKYAAENYPGETVVDDFHLFLLELVEKDVCPEKYVRENIAFYRDKVILCDDIFCGIVPDKPLMRKWREEAGRALAFAASESEEVVRVFCGLGLKLK